MSYVIAFSDSLPQGFALSSRAFDEHLLSAGLPEHIYPALAALDVSDVQAVSKLGAAIRQHINAAALPKSVQNELIVAYARLSESYGEDASDVAVRATAAALPTCAEQQELQLNVRGVPALLEAVRSCMASLFTDRAIAYRVERGVDHRQVSVSVGIQKMVGSDIAPPPAAGERHHAAE